MQAKTVVGGGGGGPAGVVPELRESFYEGSRPAVYVPSSRMIGVSKQSKKMAAQP